MASRQHDGLADFPIPTSWASRSYIRILACSCYARLWQCGGLDRKLGGLSGIGGCHRGLVLLRRALERGGVVIVGIWYAKRRASPVAPRDLKAVIGSSAGTRGMRAT